MQVNKKITLFLIVSALAFLLTGCLVPQKTIDNIRKPDSSKGHPQQTHMSRRFKPSAPNGATPMDSAIELSQKYATLVEETTILRQENQNLIAENTRLKDQFVTCEAELKQTQKELAEANDLLIEMRIELNNWKTDILGFRDEMRDADKAQLEALLKILKALGGEVKPASTKNEGSATTSPGKPSQLQPQKTKTLGEQNE